ERRRAADDDLAAHRGEALDHDWLVWTTGACCVDATDPDWRRSCPKVERTLCDDTESSVPLACPAVVPHASPAVTPKAPSAAASAKRFADRARCRALSIREPSMPRR